MSDVYKRETWALCYGKTPTESVIIVHASICLNYGVYESILEAKENYDISTT